jgi:hypothetical protein
MTIEQHPLGPGVTVYHTTNSRVTHGILKVLGLWDRFSEDLKVFYDVIEQDPSFLALYERRNTFALIHFRAPQNEGWGLFVVYEDDKKTLTAQFVDAVYDRTSAELLAETDVHIHIQKNAGN